MAPSALRFAPLLLLASQLGAPAASGREPNLCSQTAAAARRACENEVRDDFWIAVGICLNLPDDAARRTCRRAAKQERRDVTEECAGQLEARQELCDAIGQEAYDPSIDPACFVGPAAAAASPNAYVPLVPGRTWTYRSGSETTTVTVTDRTRVILGVTCTVVRDVVEENALPVEDTDDYFAQDVDGNVWYFGELSQNFENGQLTDVDGSWTAGIEGAKPGLIMRAVPVVGETYRQEFKLGDAEDAGTVLSTTASATVAGASCAGTCVQTLDFTPLEPDGQEHKFYAPEIGLILEVDLETGARNELISFAPG